MAVHWIPPPLGVLKINVHGTSSRVQSPFGFNTGIGAIYRDTNGSLKHVTLGVIPELSPLGNQLWAIFIPLVRAFNIGYKTVFLETDNLEAFITLKNFRIGAPASVYDITSQIYIRINDARWRCMISYVYPARNRVARYLSRLGKNVCEELFTLNRAVGGVEEYLAWDMGLGLDDPSYQDVVIPADAPDPAEFGMGTLLSDRVNDMGLGQTQAPHTISLDIEVDAADNLEEFMMEDSIIGGPGEEEQIFAGDSIPIAQA